MTPGLPASFSVSALGRRQPPKDERAQREPRAGALRGAARTSNTSSTFILETQRNGGRAPQGARAARDGACVGAPCSAAPSDNPAGASRRPQPQEAGSEGRQTPHAELALHSAEAKSWTPSSRQPRRVPHPRESCVCRANTWAARARQPQGVRALRQRGLSRRLLCGKLTLNFEITWLTFFF